MSLYNHIETVSQMRRDGCFAKSIAKYINDTCGTDYSEHAVAGFCNRNNLPAAVLKPSKYPGRYIYRMPRGRLNVGQLYPAQRDTLTDLAQEWGCETISEAALEILRDYLDEEAAKV